jgi:hypothetical protein
MKFEGKTFTKDVTLDYNEFIDCEIKECVIWFYGGKFSLLRTKLTNVRFAVGAAAQDTLQFLKMVRATGPNLLEELLNFGDQPKRGERPASGPPNA